MYDMHAEAEGDLDGLVWHVISKEVRTSTLCGRHLTPQRHLPPAGGGGTAVERYCSSCMTAVGSAIKGNRRPPTPA